MSNGRKLAIFLLLMLAVPLSMVLAESKDLPDVSSGGLDLLTDESKFDVVFNDFLLPEVVQYISEKGSVSILIDPESALASLKVTANLKSVTWLQFLSYLADKYEFDVEVSAQDIYTLRQPKRITLVADKAPLREVIRQIADDAAFNIVIDPAVTGDVSVFLKQVPWTHALDVILRHSPFVAVKEKYNTIIITTIEKLKEQPQTRIFRLNYIEPGGATYVPEIKTDYASRKEEKAMKSTSLIEILEAIVEKNGIVKYEAANNAVLVRASKSIIEQVEAVILELDREPLQVSIDVRIYSVNLSQIRDLGVRWQEGLVMSGTGGKATNAIVFPFTNGFDSWEKYLHGASSRGPFFSSDPIVTPGTLDASTLSATLKLLDTYTNAEVIQQPRITTLDNHAATIHVGDVIRYAEYESTTSDGGGSTGGYKEAEGSPVELGVQLLVIPHIARRDRNVMITVIPKIEDARTGNLFEEFGAGATAIKLPQTKTEVVVSKMIIPDGNTGVLAGFVKDTNAKNGNKIPLLGDIPLLGWLFKNKHTENTKSVLLIFISPTIISSASSVTVTKEFDEIRNSLHQEFVEKQKEVVKEKVKTGEVKTEPAPQP